VPGDDQKIKRDDSGSDRVNYFNDLLTGERERERETERKNKGEPTFQSRRKRNRGYPCKSAFPVKLFVPADCMRATMRPPLTYIIS